MSHSKPFNRRFENNQFQYSLNDIWVFFFVCVLRTCFHLFDGIDSYEEKRVTRESPFSAFYKSNSNVINAWTYNDDDDDDDNEDDDDDDDDDDNDTNLAYFLYNN